MRFSKKDIFTIPNIMTYFRLLCVPIFIGVIIGLDKPVSCYAAFAVFVVASFTDMLDGYIARHYNMVSDIGKVLDPIADKLLQVSTLVCLTVIGNIHWAFPLIFFLKEAYMVLGGVFIIKVFKSDYTIQANFFGKAATCLNSLGIVLSFFVQPGNQGLFGYNVTVWTILAIAAVFAIITAGIYTYQFFTYRKAELANKMLDKADSANGVECVDSAECEAQCDSVQDIEDKQ